MAEAITKSFDSPDEVIDFPLIRTSIVELGDLTVGLQQSEPGWRWSEHVKPIVGGAWCQARHVGFVISGAFGVELPDGKRYEFHAGEVFDIPPGHDGFTVGDEPCRQVEWAGIRTFTGFAPACEAACSPRCSSPTSWIRPRAPQSSETPAGVIFCRRTSSTYEQSSSDSADGR